MKRIFTCMIVVVLLVMLSPQSVWAGYSTTEDGSYVVSVSCDATSSSHSVSARGSAQYPAGIAQVTYQQFGKVYSQYVSGTSQRGYWSAHFTVPTQGQMISATTSRSNGASVTATYP